MSDFLWSVNELAQKYTGSVSLRMIETNVNSCSGVRSDIPPQFPISRCSKVSLTGRSFFMSVTYLQLFMLSCLRCCSPTKSRKGR